MEAVSMGVGVGEITAKSKEGQEGNLPPQVPAKGEPARQKWRGELQPRPAEGREAAGQASVGCQGCW